VGVAVDLECNPQLPVEPQSIEKAGKQGTSQLVVV